MCMAGAFSGSNARPGGCYLLAVLRTRYRWGILLVLLAGAARAELLVSSFNTGVVLRYDHVTGAFLGTLVAHPDLQAPHETVFGYDRQLYVASADNDRILRVSPTNGALLATLPTNGVPLDYPAGMTPGPDGLLYVSSQANDSILRYDATSGAFAGVFVPSGSGGLNGPSGLAFGPDGNLYVAGRFAPHGVYRYDGASGTFLDVFVTNRLSQPFGLCFGPDGHLYVANGNSNHVARFHGASGAFIDIFTSGGGLSLPVGLTFGPDTNLYVANYGGDTVARYDRATGAFLGNVMTAGAGGLDGPNFLTFRPEPRPAPVTAATLETDAGSTYLALHVAKGTNTGPVEILAEISDDLLSGTWRGDTNVVILEDSALRFRARDAQPITNGATRALRARYVQP